MTYFVHGFPLIKDRYTPPTKMDGDKIVPKHCSKWDEKDFNLTNLNSRAISCIINGFNSGGFHKVMNLTYAKEIWEYLEVTYEETKVIIIAKSICLH